MGRSPQPTSPVHCATQSLSKPVGRAVAYRNQAFAPQHRDPMATGIGAIRGGRWSGISLLGTSPLDYERWMDLKSRSFQTTVMGAHGVACEPHVWCPRLGNTRPFLHVHLTWHIDPGASLMSLGAKQLPNVRWPDSLSTQTRLETLARDASAHLATNLFALLRH